MRHLKQIEKECEWCKKTFIGQARKAYCSSRCSRASHYSREKNPMEKPKIVAPEGIAQKPKPKPKAIFVHTSGNSGKWVKA